MRMLFFIRYKKKNNIEQVIMKVMIKAPKLGPQGKGKLLLKLTQKRYQHIVCIFHSRIF